MKTRSRFLYMKGCMGLICLTLFLFGCKGQDDVQDLNKEEETDHEVSLDPVDDGNDLDVDSEEWSPMTEMPTYLSLPVNRKLPDPFKFYNSDKRIKNDEDWKLRREEISRLAQEFEYGNYQETPYEATSGAYNGTNRITVTVTDNGVTKSFDCNIDYPEVGEGPFPAIIGIGGISLNNAELKEKGVAIINFPNGTVGEQNGGASRGKGLFFDIYGSDHTASATMAWAWGVSRLIDALEKTPEANIDTEHLGVSGCSRNGKGALTVGAFEERIKLTVPQEPGAGGASSWRISDAQLDQGMNVQTLHQIVTENVWFTERFADFSYTSSKLPFDQHSILGLVAPRGLLVIENTSQEWLSARSAWVSANAAHKIWEALGMPDNMGFSQVGGHNHCAFPASQSPELMAYVRKFLFDDASPDTEIMFTDGFYKEIDDYSEWVDWTIPQF